MWNVFSNSYLTSIDLTHPSISMANNLLILVPASIRVFILLYPKDVNIRVFDDWVNVIVDVTCRFRRLTMRSPNWTRWTKTRTRTPRWSCSCCETTWRFGRQTRRVTATSRPRVATTNRCRSQHTHLFSLVFYKKTSNIRERRAVRLLLSLMRAVACKKC